jgi:hypothetical protein
MTTILDAVLRETAAVPDPDPDLLEAVRAALISTITATSLEADVRAVTDRPTTSGAGPVGPGPSGTSGDVLSVTRFGWTAREARTRRGRPRRLAVGLVAVAATTALVLAVPTLDLGDGGPAAPADAAQLLLQAGRSAGEQPAPPADAPYWHSVAEYRQGSGAVHRREIWLSRSGDGVLHDGRSVMPLDGPARFPLASRSLTWAELDRLTTDATELGAELRAARVDSPGKVRDRDADLFIAIGDLLRESPASPALRRALFTVAAGIPGVRRLGAVLDQAGRPGEAVELGLNRYVIDPDDGRLLEEESGTAEGLFRGTYLTSGPARTAPRVTAVPPAKGEVKPAPSGDPAEGVLGG